MSVWFTADLHFGHKGMITRGLRPFTSVEEMDEILVTNWNTCVSPKDRIYILGDFSFRKTTATLELIARLNGTKYLILGNHDRGLSAACRKEFEWVGDLKEIKVKDTRIVMCHYPMLTWNKSHYGSWMLHGHSHGSLAINPNAKRLDVGVDCFDYAPVHITTLQSIMESRVFVPIDHHGTSLGPIRK